MVCEPPSVVNSTPINHMRNIPRCLVTVAAGAVTLLMLATSVCAQVQVSNPDLPVVYPDGVYRSPTGVNTTFNVSGLGNVWFTDMELRALPVPSRGPSGPNEIENFNSQMSELVSIDGLFFFPASGNGPAQTETFNKIGNVTGTFSTEMLALNLNGNGPFGPFMIRESPTKTSPGQTTITDLGGGQFGIDSFFDVFTELSLDGGQTWIPSETSTRFDLQGQGVPETGGTFVLLLISASVLGLCQIRNQFSRRPAR
jgi:hypothetical protein